VLNNTFLYIVILLAINFVVPYILAYILHSKIKNRKNLFKSTIFLPSVISLVVGSMLYLWLLNPVSGPAGIIAKMIGIEIPNWTKTEGLVIVVLSLITSWKVFGYNFIILYAGIMGVNQDVIETAIIDNVPSWRIFKDIILPMSSASGIYVFIITVVQGLQYVFIPIKVVTQGGPDYASSNLTYQSYHEAFTLYRVGPSSAFSVLTLIIFGLLLYLEYKYVEVGAYYEN
jgi:sn-glycerol 3-phosphate transport system permease protein